MRKFPPCGPAGQPSARESPGPPARPRCRGRVSRGREMGTGANPGAAQRLLGLLLQHSVYEQIDIPTSAELPEVAEVLAADHCGNSDRDAMDRWLAVLRGLANKGVLPLVKVGERAITPPMLFASSSPRALTLEQEVRAGRKPVGSLLTADIVTVDLASLVAAKRLLPPAPWLDYWLQACGVESVAIKTKQRKTLAPLLPGTIRTDQAKKILANRLRPFGYTENQVASVIKDRLFAKAKDLRPSRGQIDEEPMYIAILTNELPKGALPEQIKAFREERTRRGISLHAKDQVVKQARRAA